MDIHTLILGVGQGGGKRVKCQGQGLGESGACRFMVRVGDMVRHCVKVLATFGGGIRGGCGRIAGWERAGRFVCTAGPRIHPSIPRELGLGLGLGLGLSCGLGLGWAIALQFTHPS